MNLPIILIIYLGGLVSSLTSESQSINAVEKYEDMNFNETEETKNFTEIL